MIYIRMYVYDFVTFLVDGGWSFWYNQTECSVSCGGGVLTQWRNCTQPTPSCGGSECQGENVITVDCNTHYCCPGTCLHTYVCTRYNTTMVYIVDVLIVIITTMF